MRTCPTCKRSMNTRIVKGAEIDTCPGCNAVFLDAGEADVTGIDTAKFFGLKARPAGLGRTCPCGGAPMTRFHVDLGGSSIEIDRASCCGGVFLEAGEHEALMGDGSESLGKPKATARRCPRCSTVYQAFLDDSVEIDSCSGCGSLFLDLSDVAGSGIDTAALFGVGPEAMRAAGPSELSCPEHGVLMAIAQVELMGQTLEIDRTTCCDGVFLDGGEHSPFVSAARRATSLWADRKAAAGETVRDPMGLKRVLEANATLIRRAAVDAAIRTARDRAARRAYRKRHGKRRRRRRRLGRL